MQRDFQLNQLQQNPDKQWDMVVIGGGATGLGIAVDAATRGYETLLLEQSDFAKGTSSRSTKLVHGGVRYLAQGDISLVLEALHERGLLRRNVPHLVKNQAFIIPSYDWWEGPFYNIGMKVYDMMAGKLGLGPSEKISRQATLKAIPNLEVTDTESGKTYRAQVIWAVRHEMARTVEDFLSRRIRMLLLDARTSLMMAPEVADIMARELNQDPGWIRSQVADYQALVKGYILSPTKEIQ